MLDTVCEPELNNVSALMSNDVMEPDVPSDLCLDGPGSAQQPAFQQCFHDIMPGHRCNAPALRGEYFCRHHMKRARVIVPPNTPFDLPPIYDRESLRDAVLLVAGRLAANSLDVRRAGNILYSLQIVATTFPPLPRPRAALQQPAEDTGLSRQTSALGEADDLAFPVQPEHDADSSTMQHVPVLPGIIESTPVSRQEPQHYPARSSIVPIPHSCYAPPGWKPMAAPWPEPQPPNEPATIAAIHACAEDHPSAQYPAPSTSTIMEATMRISPSKTTNALPHALICAALIAAVALASTPLLAQAAHSAAGAHTATHTGATTHTGAATAGGCVTIADLSPKIPAVPAGSPCPKALYTISRVPDIRIDYVNPAEGDLAKTLGIEPDTFTLGYVDTHIGTGALAQPNKYYTVKYTGYLADGSVFDASDKHAETADGITFQIGAHQVVAGWDTGFAGMHVGGKRRLFIPYQLAYGPNGRPPTIPAKAELIFDMELVSQSDTPPAPKTPPAAAAPKPATPPPAAGAPASAQPATPTATENK